MTDRTDLRVLVAIYLYTLRGGPQTRALTRLQRDTKLAPEDLTQALEQLHHSGWLRGPREPQLTLPGLTVAAAVARAMLETRDKAA